MKRSTPLVVFPVDPTVSSILRVEADEHPRWPDVLCRRALCLLAEGHETESRELFERALAVNPRYGWAVAGLAQVQGLAGDVDAAASLLQGPATEPAPGVFVWIQAYLDLLGGMPEAGEAALDALPPGQRTRPDVLRLRAALRRGRAAGEAELLVEEAARAFRAEGVSDDWIAPWDASGNVEARLLTLVPAMSRFWLEASGLLARLGRPIEAERSAAIAHLHWADPGYLYHQRGNLATFGGDEEAARRWYLRAIDVAPGHPEPYIALVYHWSAAGRLEEADRALNAALERAPRYADLHHQRGLLRRAKRDLVGALESFQHASGINPRYALARLNEAITLADLERWETAAQAFTSVLQLGLRSADILLHVGQIAERRGDDAGAEAAYREAVALQPEEPLAHYRLGNLHRRLGRRGEAKAAWTRFLELAADPEAARVVRDLLRTAEDAERAPGEERS